MENRIEKNELLEKIIELLEEKKYGLIRSKLLETNAVIIAEVFEDIIDEVGVEKITLLFRTLPKSVSVDVFAYLPIEDQVKIINTITEQEVSYIMDELDFDDMIDVLEELPANLVDKILEQTKPEERKLINTFLNYPDTCAGSLMTPDYISLLPKMTVGEALAYIKKEGMDSETVYTCYVKDQSRNLLGIVSLRKLVITDDSVKIEDIMKENAISLNVYEDQEEVSEVFKKYDFLAMPVVDNENRLVGIITVDDIMDVIEEETTEDMERMAGVIDDSDKDYLSTGVWSHVRNRLPWLFLLMCSYVVTGGIIASFEDVLSKVISLVAYLPMLMGTGGNSGSQSATLIIRGMSLDDIELSDAGKVLWKEIQISGLIGFFLSLLNFGRIYFLEHQPMDVAITVCGAMLFIVMAAKIIGGMLPMLAKKIGVDPALMATPTISSLTDMVSVVTYFMLAKVILGI